MPGGRDRILRLEGAGVTNGYQAVINPDAFGQGVLRIVQLKTDQQLNFDRLVDEILTIDEVVSVDILYYLKLR